MSQTCPACNAAPRRRQRAPISRSPSSRSLAHCLCCTARRSRPTSRAWPARDPALRKNGGGPHHGSVERTPFGTPDDQPPRCHDVHGPDHEQHVPRRLARRPTTRRPNRRPRCWRASVDSFAATIRMRAGSPSAQGPSVTASARTARDLPCRGGRTARSGRPVGPHCRQTRPLSTAAAPPRLVRRTSHQALRLASTRRGNQQAAASTKPSAALRTARRHGSRRRRRRSRATTRRPRCKACDGSRQIS